jgi:two-component system response regulator MtrA
VDLSAITVTSSRGVAAGARRRSSYRDTPARRRPSGMRPRSAARSVTDQDRSVTVVVSAYHNRCAPASAEPEERMGQMASRILVVDDDTALAEMIGIVLRTEGFDPIFCADGSAAVDAWRQERPELVLLDLMLPGMDGIEICTRIRAESGVPIIMLTARTDTADVVRGLESGADDYIVKPFNPKELVARIRTRLRPASTAPAEVLRIGDLSVDVAAHEVRRGDEVIALTPLEFELLVALASKPQQVFSREALLEQVWGYHYKADTRLVNVHVQRLRAKVEIDPDNPRIVMTVRGVGYRAGAAV